MGVYTLLPTQVTSEQPTLTNSPFNASKTQSIRLVQAQTVSQNWFGVEYMLYFAKNLLLQAHLQNILPQAIQSQRHCSYWWIIKGTVHLKFELTHHYVAPNLLTVFHALLKNCHDAFHKKKDLGLKIIKEVHTNSALYSKSSEAIWQFVWCFGVWLCSLYVEPSEHRPRFTHNFSGLCEEMKFKS